RSCGYQRVAITRLPASSGSTHRSRAQQALFAVGRSVEVVTAPSSNRDGVRDFRGTARMNVPMEPSKHAGPTLDSARRSTKSTRTPRPPTKIATPVEPLDRHRSAASEPDGSDTRSEFQLQRDCLFQ